MCNLITLQQRVCISDNGFLLAMNAEHQSQKVWKLQQVISTLLHLNGNQLTTKGSHINPLPARLLLQRTKQIVQYTDKNVTQSQLS
jgi:hypothetical protein